MNETNNRYESFSFTEKEYTEEGILDDETIEAIPFIVKVQMINKKMDELCN